jgi:hypothetical protein
VGTFGTKPLPLVKEAISVFIQPLRLKGGKKIEDYDWVKSSHDSQYGTGHDICITPENIQWEKKIIFLGTERKTRTSLYPTVWWIPEREWLALVIKADIHAIEDRLSLNDLLTFNVGFRKTIGDPDPDDTQFGVSLNDLKIDGERSCSEIYREYADLILGRDCYEPLLNLRKAVVLSYAKFDRILDDGELYRFGTIAFPGEPITPEWLKTIEESTYDRWKVSGWRIFAYSYSMVYALSENSYGRDDEQVRDRFLSDYVKMGVSIAIQRAMLQDYPAKIRNADRIMEIRKYHKEMAEMSSYFSVRFTSEGTQSMRIEQIWKRSTGIDDRMNETKQLLDQKIEILEADAAAKLNNRLLFLQYIMGTMAGVQIGAAIAKEPIVGVVWGLLGSVTFMVTVQFLWEFLSKIREK